MTHAEAIERLSHFAELKENWDSYGAKVISPKAIDTAKAVLFRLGPGFTPVPTTDGGVQLEFHDDGMDIEVYIGEA